MDWHDLKWSNCDFVVSDSTIAEVEAALSIRFPADYLEIIRRYNGGTPSKRTFTVSDRKGTMRSCLARLLTFQLNRNENILEMNALLKDQLPRGLTCIGEDGGGDFICFDSKAAGDNRMPFVVYWHHETDEVSFLNDNFVGFLEMLE